MVDKVVAIVPAHNEADYIKPVIESLNKCIKAGVISDYRIVDNASTDSTVRVAERAGAKGKIISIPEKGKGRAFVKGFFWADSVKADTLVTLDADLEKFSPKQINELVLPVKSKSVNMSIASVEEPLKLGLPRLSKSYWFCPFYLTGIRAIRMTALKPLRIGNKRWLSLLGKNFELERGLGFLIKKAKPINSANPFRAARPPYRGGEFENNQVRQVRGARRYILSRKNKARRLKQLRVSPEYSLRLRRRTLK